MDICSSRYGNIAIIDRDTDLIGRFISHYGEWAFLETQFIAQCLPQNARVLDVGAFIGTFSLGLCAESRVSYICAVEANPATFPLLTRNLANILTIPYEAIEALVVGKKAEKRNAHAPANNAGATSYAEFLDGDKVYAPPAQTEILSDIIANSGPFDLVKLDVEGMEYEVLSAAREIISSNDTILWVECNETLSSVQLAELLLSTGRSVWYFAWPSHNPQNFRSQDSAIFEVAYEAGILFGVDKPQISSELVAAGCILRPLFTTADLTDALWRTPRWGEAGWLQATKQELMGMLSHLLVGAEQSSFLKEQDFARQTADIVTAQRALAAERFRADQYADALAHSELDHHTRLVEANRRFENQLAGIIAKQERLKDVARVPATQLHDLESARWRFLGLFAAGGSGRKVLAQLPGARALWHILRRR